MVQAGIAYSTAKAVQTEVRTDKKMFLTKRTRQLVENKGSAFLKCAKRTPNEPRKKGRFRQNELCLSGRRSASRSLEVGLVLGGRLPAVGGGFSPVNPRLPSVDFGQKMFLTKRTRQLVENKGSAFLKCAKRTPDEPQTNPEKGPISAKRTGHFALIFPE